MRWMAMIAALPAALACGQDMMTGGGEEARPADGAQESGVPRLANVQTFGEGETHLVLVPGLACDMRVWRPFIERNHDRFTMHAVTLPGFGGTEALATPTDNTGTPWLDNAVGAIAELIRGAEGVDEAVVVGHSLGGLVAYRLATEHPGLVRGAVAVDAFPAFPVPGMGPIPEAQRVQLVEAAMPQVLTMDQAAWEAQVNAGAATQFADPAQFEAFRPMFHATEAGVGARYMLELMKTDLTDDLAASETPVLTIAARHDDQAELAGGEEAYRQVWTGQTENADSVELVWADDSRHFVMFDKPAWFDEQVRAFVDRVSENGEG